MKKLVLFVIVFWSSLGLTGNWLDWFSGYWNQGPKNVEQEKLDMYYLLKEECKYQGTDTTVQDVLGEELDSLNNAMQKLAQETRPPLLLPDAPQDLPEGSLLRYNFEKRDKAIPFLAGLPNKDFIKQIDKINKHANSNICLCCECKAVLERDVSLIQVRNELYQAINESVADLNSDECDTQESPFLLIRIKNRLPEKSVWNQKIDQALQGKQSKAGEKNFKDVFADNEKNT